MYLNYPASATVSPALLNLFGDILQVGVVDLRRGSDLLHLPNAFLFLQVAPGQGSRDGLRRWIRWEQLIVRHPKSLSVGHQTLCSFYDEGSLMTAGLEHAIPRKDMLGVVDVNPYCSQA